MQPQGQLRKLDGERVEVYPIQAALDDEALVVGLGVLGGLGVRGIGVPPMRFSVLHGRDARATSFGSGRLGSVAIARERKSAAPTRKCPLPIAGSRIFTER